MSASPPERTPGKKAILIVDDHPLMRHGLTALIDSEPDLVVCAEAGNRQAALEAIARRPPDMAIVDLSLEGGEDGLDLVKALKIRSPSIPALVLSMHPEAIYAERVAGRRTRLSRQATARRGGACRHPPRARRPDLYDRSARDGAGVAFRRRRPKTQIAARDAQRPRVAGVPSHWRGAAHAGDRADPQSEPEDDRILSRTLEAEAGHRRLTRAGPARRPLFRNW